MGVAHVAILEGYQAPPRRKRRSNRCVAAFERCVKKVGRRNFTRRGKISPGLQRCETSYQSCRRGKKRRR